MRTEQTLVPERAVAYQSGTGDVLPGRVYMSQTARVPLSTSSKAARVEPARSTAAQLQEIRQKREYLDQLPVEARENQVHQGLRVNHKGQVDDIDIRIAGDPKIAMRVVGLYLVPELVRSYLNSETAEITLLDLTGGAQSKGLSNAVADAGFAQLSIVQSPGVLMYQQTPTKAAKTLAHSAPNLKEEQHEMAANTLRKLYAGIARAEDHGLAPSLQRTDDALNFLQSIMEPQVSEGGAVNPVPAANQESSLTIAEQERLISQFPDSYRRSHAGIIGDLQDYVSGMIVSENSHAMKYQSGNQPPVGQYIVSTDSQNVFAVESMNSLIDTEDAGQQPRGAQGKPQKIIVIGGDRAKPKSLKRLLDTAHRHDIKTVVTFGEVTTSAAENLYSSGATLAYVHNGHAGQAKIMSDTLGTKSVEEELVTRKQVETHNAERKTEGGMVNRILHRKSDGKEHKASPAQTEVWQKEKVRVKKTVPVIPPEDITQMSPFVVEVMRDNERRKVTIPPEAAARRTVKHDAGNTVYTLGATVSAIKSVITGR